MPATLFCVWNFPVVAPVGDKMEAGELMVPSPAAGGCGETCAY